MCTSSVDRDPFELLAEEFAERLRRGEHPSLTEYVARCPERAADIQELFPALALVERFKPSGQVSAVPFAPAVQAIAADLPGRMGDYRILRYLGEGGMGVVYEAVRESLRSHVALKVMHPQFRNREGSLRRFRTEARSAARLHHTNIVSVFDYGIHEGVCYYAMQYIAGQSLDKILGDIRQLRQENEGSAGAPVTFSRAEGGAAPPADRGNLRDAGSMPTDCLRRTVTMGLLTGHYPSTPRAEDSEYVGPPVFTTSSAPPTGAADESDLMAILAKNLAVGTGSTISPETEATEPQPVRLGEPGTFHSGVTGLYERPADATDPGGPGDPSFDGSTSSLARRTDDRYYREVARLGAQIADALAYAHRRGVLHRDIKPPNLILDPLGNVWITDFGLAKSDEGDDLSQSHDLIGTLRYMAPERFRGVSTAQCDVYALGATLYEMLTLHPPFRGKDQLQLIHQVENEPPVPPREIERRVPRDLETIVLKALAKSPGDRFDSAKEMADELRRFLENRPILSRPIPPYQHLWRWCKRNPGLAWVSLTAAVLVIVLAAGSPLVAWTLRNQRDQIRNHLQRVQSSEALARSSGEEARKQLFQALYDRARAQRFSRQAGQRFRSLAAIEEAVRIGRELNLPPEKFEPLRDEAIACLALPDLEPVGRVITRPPGVIATVFDASMTRYALRFRDGTISVRQAADDREIARFQALNNGALELSSDGRYLASCTPPGGGVTVWDIERRAVAVNDSQPISHANSCVLSRDGRRLYVAHDDGMLLSYDLATGRVVSSYRGPAPARHVAIRADSGRIAVLYNEKTPTCHLVEPDNGRFVRSIALPAAANWVAWSPDGATLATACEDKKIYLWDAGTGTRMATLEGHVNLGLSAAFHPAGSLLASCGWEGRTWLWDTVLGRPWLSLTGGFQAFSRDGRIVLESQDRLIPYRVDPATEYRTLTRPSREPGGYARPSIRHDGRLLAVGTGRGALIWDLARGTELAFLPIGNAWNLMFEPSGDLITSGSIGVQRWPIRLDPGRGEFRIGPPGRLRLPVSFCGISADRSGRIVALGDHASASVATPGGTVRVGPLEDCRGVSVSPDGQWLATGTHSGTGAQVWRTSDFTKVADLPLDYGTSVEFSPDGRWLATENPPCRLWEVGTWREVWQIGGYYRSFSRDGRLVVVYDASRVLRLVDTETGRTLARLESPDSCQVDWATFSPDGSRLVATTADGPAVHVWDLRAIRKHLAGKSLDWDAPAYSEDDPAAPSAPPLPTPEVVYGPLARDLEHLSGDAETLLRRYTARIESGPRDADAYHHRAHALIDRRRIPEAIQDLTRAIDLRPTDAHYRAFRGAIYLDLKQLEPAIADLEAALALQPEQFLTRERLSLCCNNRAWELANGHGPRRDLDRALVLAQRAADLTPGEGVSLNTLGVVLYRAARYDEAVAVLERSLAAGRGQFDGFDLYFLAMAHHRLGHRDQARGCFDRAVRWVQAQRSLHPKEARELAGFRAEAEAVLAGPSGEMPDNVFAEPR